MADAAAPAIAGDYTDRVDGAPRERLDLGDVPSPILAVVETLAAHGHDAFLVGGCVRDLLVGRNVADYDVATSAGPEALLELFPRAVPIGVRHGTVMVPTGSGPVDVTSFRAGPSLEDDLAHRDFTVNAMAYDPLRGELVDPFGGRADLAKGVLNAVGAASERFAEDPLRALRAARLMATDGFDVAVEVERAMPGAGRGLPSVARERIRHELERLLLGPDARAAVELLRRTGLEGELLPGASDDAPGVIERLPADVELRLAAWLRGARVAVIARRLRLGRRRAARITRLLELHPIEQQPRSMHPPDVRRLMKRAGEERLPALLALREAELGAGPEDPAARTRLAALRQAIEGERERGALALRRVDLALDGADVMRILKCQPGPAVGRALAHLTEQVIDVPSRNTPEQLRTLLETWAASAATP